MPIVTVKLSEENKFSLNSTSGKPAMTGSLDTFLHTNMAGTKKSSMAHELFELTRPKDYVTYLSSINNRDRTGIAAFKQTSFSEDYDVDTSYLYPKGRRTNNYHVYDMFGRLAGMDGVETKKCMLQEIEARQSFYQARGNVVLSMLRLTIEDWIAYAQA